MDNLVASFSKFAALAKDAVIYNGDDVKTVRAVRDSGASRLISFGYTAGNDWYAENITFFRGAFPEFDVMYRGEKQGCVRLRIPGQHNVLNALAAIAAAVHAGAAIEDVLLHAGEFGGAGRRFEILGEYHGVTIADDYAHHPAELRVTLEAAKKMDYKRVWAVFQPFTFSRTYMLLEDFADVLSIADKVVLTEIMGSREVNTYDIHTKDLCDKIEGAVHFTSFDTIARYLYENAEEGDLVLTLGCGDVYKIAKKLIALYQG